MYENSAKCYGTCLPECSGTFWSFKNGWLFHSDTYFILVLNSGCIMLIYRHMHGDSALIFLFCNQCDLLKDMIIVYVFFFKRISFSSSWNFGSNLKLISAWLRNPVLSITCFMSFELYYVGISFLFC